ncbi:hypothetical protein [Sphingobacterium sp.]|uniref:hypothetical protein n=1 Tax=Sphingobacterium sp. TaxID=341027 RepID=UPI0028B038C1|nr:hypothetical protein [Sphingobacterium sp.]
MPFDVAQDKGWEDKPRSGLNQDGGDRRMDQDYSPVRKVSPLPGVPNLYKQPSFRRKSFSTYLNSLAEKMERIPMTCAMGLGFTAILQTKNPQPKAEDHSNKNILFSY